MDDDAQLQLELDWRRPDPAFDRRVIKTRPAGVNVILGLAAAIGLALFGAYLSLATKLSFTRGLGSVIAGCFAFAGSLLIAHILATRLWQVMGSTVRGILRPLGLLGPLPVILGATLVVGSIAFFAQGVSQGKDLETLFTGGPSSGEDFAATLDDRGRLMFVELDGASKACAARGPGWRLPAKGDEAFLTTRVLRYELRQRPLWSAPAAEDERYQAVFQFDVRGERFQRALGHFERAGVLCVLR